jgi:hypothetical protein
MKVGDLVRFRRDIVGLEGAMGIVLEEHDEHNITVKWWNHHDHIAEEDVYFLETISESR